MAELFDVLTSDFEEVSNITVTADHDVPAWDTIVTQTITNLAAGKYMAGVNFLIDYGSVKDKSAWSRVTGTYFAGIEFADRATTDAQQKTRWYEKEIIHTGGNLTITLEMSCGTGLTDFLVNSAQVVINRVN